MVSTLQFLQVLTFLTDIKLRWNIQFLRNILAVFFALSDTLGK